MQDVLTDELTPSIASTTFTISDNVISPDNLAPIAQPVSPAKNLKPGQSIALTELFTWNDPNGISDVVSFAVRDRDVGGGYLTKNGTKVEDGKLFDDIPITEIANWAFVAGVSGSVDNVVFNAIDAAGEFSTPSAVTTITVTTIETLKSASSLELEFFARQVAYDDEPYLSTPGQEAPTGHFAEGWTLEEEFTAADGLFRAVTLTKPGFHPVLAIRGTDTNIPDWISNTSTLGVGGSELAWAWNESDGVKQWLIEHPNASLTGHSQGGAQAQMIAYLAARSSIKLGQLVTFNSSGVNKNAIDLAGTLDPSNVTHFISAGDIVSQVGEQFVPGKIKYYDFNYNGPTILLTIIAHINHWAQRELYDKNFFREVYPDASRTIRISSPDLTNEELTSLDFSHLTPRPNIDDEYSIFKTQIQSFLTSAIPIALLIGIGPGRVAEILSNRESSELAREKDLPKLLNLLGDWVTLVKELTELGYTFTDETFDLLGSILSLPTRLSYATPGEALILGGSILMKAFDLGYKTKHELLEFVVAVFEVIADYGFASPSVIGDYLDWYSDLIVKLGDSIGDMGKEILIKTLSKSADFSKAVIDRFIPGTLITVAEGIHADSTPAIIVDGKTGESLMKSASGDSIFIVDEGKESIEVTGGKNLIWGLPSAMDGTSVKGFGATDTLFIGEVKLEHDDLSAVKGSAILTLDTDDDDRGDTVITLAGDFRLESFIVEASSSGSYIRYLGNAIPVAENDDKSVLPKGFITNEGSAITTANVLANDSDGDGDVLHISALDTTDTRGLVINNGDGTFNYNPNGAFDYLNAGERATDSFVYTVSDGNGGSDTATVFIEVMGVEDGVELFGTTRSETLNGTAGDDRIRGNDGSDTLKGGAGNDWLAGEKGSDILFGGLGKDVFFFSKGGGGDTISDFTNGFDKIQIAADTGITSFSCSNSDPI